MVVSANGPFALPPDADSQQLAVPAINPPTAALVLSEYVNLKPGDWVVQNSANSGVGRWVIAFAKARGLKRLALFGTKFTMQGRSYRDVFARKDIAVVVPDAADQDYIHEKYMSELVAGVFLPETRAGLLAVVDRLAQQANVDGVILGGTELPLILRDPAHDGIPLLNTTRIHCEAAVERMLS